jgi:hypothetical protein
MNPAEPAVAAADGGPDRVHHHHLLHYSIIEY